MDFEKFKEEYRKLSTEEERKKFINYRTKLLSLSSDNRKTIGLNVCGSYDQFVSPETQLKSNGSTLYPGLIIDDDIYSQFMNYIGNDVDTIRVEPFVVDSIQSFIWNYFGYNSGGYNKRESFYGEHIQEGVVSLSELKGKNIAACSERSVVVHNLLMFLGLESEIVFGKLNNKEPHAYVIFKSGQGNFRILYDPMNPVVGIKDGKKGYYPGIDILQEEDYKTIKEGGSYHYNYNRSKKVFYIDEIVEAKDRNYSCDDYKYTKKNNFTI